MTEDWQRPAPDAQGFRRDVAGAALIAGGMALTTMLYSRVGYYEDPAPLWLTITVIAAMTLPLAVRRRQPELVAVIISIAFFVGQQFSVPELLISNIALFMAIYTVGAWSRHRRAATIVRVLIIIAMFVWIAVNLVISVSNPELMPDVSRAGIFSQFASFALINLVTNVLYFGGAYYFGDRMWAAARSRAELEERTLELDREREHSARQAVALDRVRIARELHDVVAHHVSVMGVQAGAARRVLAADPQQASESLGLIEQSARSAVEELHGLVTTLRETDADGSVTDAASESASTRGVERLPELVEECRTAGTPTQLHVIGEPRPVTALIGFTLYRLAQEALTNVRKHAGDRATADVRLRYLPDGIELEVTDDGLGRGLGARGAGMGHRGMRERVAAVGGAIEVGPRSRGGYLVRASIPLGDAAAVSPAPTAVGADVAAVDSAVVASPEETR